MQTFKRLPKVEKLGLPEQERTEFLELDEKLHKQEIALSFLLQQVKDTKRQALSDVSRHYQQKMQELQKELDKYKGLLSAYKLRLDEIDNGIIRKYQSKIAAQERAIADNENTIKALRKSYEEYYSLSKNLAAMYQKSEAENHEMKALVKELDSKNRQMEQSYNMRLDEIKKKHEQELAASVRSHMESELTLSTKVEAMKVDLVRYMDLLRSERTKQKKFVESINKLVLETYPAPKKKEDTPQF